jgi:hypothetical protein
VILVAWLIGILAWWVSWAYPEVGTKPLIHTGGLLVLMIVLTQFSFHPSSLSDADLALVDQGLAQGDKVAIMRAVDDKVQGAFPRLADVARQPDSKPGSHDPAVKLAADREAIARAAEMHAVADAAGHHGSIWPVFLAGAAFLYIWWLAILLFDLTFVWHLYIRWPGAENYVRKRRGAAATSS